MSYSKTTNPVANDDAENAPAPSTITSILRRPTIAERRARNITVRPADIPTNSARAQSRRHLGSGRELWTPTDVRSVSVPSIVSSRDPLPDHETVQVPTLPTVPRVRLAASDESPSLDRAMGNLNLFGSRARNTSNAEDSDGDDKGPDADSVPRNPAGNPRRVRFQLDEASDPEPVTANSTPSTLGETLVDVDGVLGHASAARARSNAGIFASISTQVESDEGDYRLDKSDDSMDTIHGLDWEEGDGFFYDEDLEDDPNTDNVLLGLEEYGGKDIRDGGR